MKSRIVLHSLWFLVLSFCFLNPGCQPASHLEQPNILFIIGDDISWNDIGCYGNPLVKTPHIDRMARSGIRFSNMYLTSSSCSPSRTSILTGRYPHNTGAAELHTSLPEYLLFFPEQLRKAGYFTGLLGKWHEGPATRRAYDTLLAGKEHNGPGGEEQWINVLKARPKNKPFFFWLATFDAHRNWSEDGFAVTHDPATEVRVPPSLADTRETRADLASYYNEIARIDHYIGQLEKELEKEGVAENTIIIFMADNGRPFPGSKTTLYDSGLRTPFVIKWPGGIAKKGITCQSLVSSIDIAPTLLELAGAETGPSIQGKSFAQLLERPETDFRTYVFGEHNWHDYQALERSVRTNDLLYVRNLRPGLDNAGAIDVNQGPAAEELRNLRGSGSLSPLQTNFFTVPRPSEELYDCSEDPFQERNLAGDPAYKGDLVRLRNVVDRWREETGDTSPEQLTPDWYDRETGKPLPEKGKRGEMPGAAKRADTINVKGPF